MRNYVSTLRVFVPGHEVNFVRFAVRLRIRRIYILWFIEIRGVLCYVAFPLVFIIG